MVDTESLVPPGHLLRQVDAAVDFEKLYEIVEPLYSEEEGRRSIDPVVLFKIVLLQHLDGNSSLRGTLRRAQTDIAYRWFLRYTLSEELPHFSTVSCNFRHRYTSETIEAVFQWILKEAGTAGALTLKQISECSEAYGYTGTIKLFKNGYADWKAALQKFDPEAYGAWLRMLNGDK